MHVQRTPTSPLGVVLALPRLSRDVAASLAPWQARAAAIPDPELRRQALASLRDKRFHCEGGAVYALAAGSAAPAALRYIVALQTISDYLDNLCDRAPGAGPPGFRRLHDAMRAAVLPPQAATRGGFYDRYPHQDDAGYLDALVAACQAEVMHLRPERRTAFCTEAARLAAWYSELQEHKHRPREREIAVRTWADGLAADAPGLAWWEIAAATGSTLGIFALFAAAAGGPLNEVAALKLRRAYFPWVTGLHILLDYWIDREEDRRGGDMNFTFWYPDATAAAARLALFGRRAAAAVSPLPLAGFHRTVVRGLPALYLSDPKVTAQGLARPAGRTLQTAGPGAWLLCAAVRWLRARGSLRASTLQEAPRL